MSTHIDMLVTRIMYASSGAALLRGVRRSREIALRHGVSWPLVRDAAFGQARARKGVAL